MLNNPRPHRIRFVIAVSIFWRSFYQLSLKNVEVKSILNSQESGILKGIEKPDHSKPSVSGLAVIVVSLSYGYNYNLSGSRL